MRVAWAALVATLFVTLVSAQPQTRTSLDLYLIDVEGGNATLLVSPAGESLLIDTANGGAAATRDADRIMAAVRDAGVTEINHLVTTHFHTDHIGAMAELTGRIPVRHFIDPGPNVEARMNDFVQNIYPGLYENDAQGIRARVATLQRKIDAAAIPLELTFGADAHLTPELFARIEKGTAPTLHGSRYFLLEPPHHVAPPRFEESVFAFVAAGYVPLITHPERLSWIDGHYRVFEALAKGGSWMQITAGSLAGRFGSNAQYWAERMLDDGIVHVIATDAHGVKHRAPLLAEGMQLAEKWIGAQEARRLVVDRPQAVLDDLPVSEVPPAPALAPQGHTRRSRGVWAKIIGRRVRF